MKVIKKRLIGFVIVMVYACGGGFIYAGEGSGCGCGNNKSYLRAPGGSPFHYPHIKIWDFNRAMEYAPAPQRSQAYDFLAAHIDVVESAASDNSKSLELKERNPDIRTSKYELDLTEVQMEWEIPAEGLTEDMYLHFAETTTYLLNGQSITIPGCSDPAHPTKESRVQTHIWGTYRWIYNQSNPAFRVVMANHLNTMANLTSSDGIFLDEHGPGLIEANGLYGVTISGGKLLEYGGKNITKVDADYHADLVISLAYYKQFLSPKFIVINGAVWSANHPLIIAQIKAVGGTVTEFLVLPTVGDGGPNFENLLKGLDESIAAGAMVDLYGLPGGHHEIATLPTWTPGNYSSQVGRWEMWRLAYYYLIREMEGGPGEVYFSPDFDMSLVEDPLHCLDFINDWMPAYEVNVGLPDGPRNPIYAQGIGTWGPAPIHWQVFARFFDNENVLVLLRPPDSWDTQNYGFGDNTGVQITLDKPRYLLREDGTFPAQPSNTITLRNSESAILFVSTAAIPPPVTNTISGTITYNGNGLAGVRLNGLPGNPATNASGVYTATMNQGWSRTATPVLAGYTFDPVNRTYTNVTANQTGQDYTASASSSGSDPSGEAGGGGGCFIGSVTKGSIRGFVAWFLKIIFK
jgi:hypothetical protein